MERVTMTMIDEFELSEEETKDLRAYAVFRFIKDGMDAERTYEAFGTTPEEVASYRTKWLTMSNSK